MFELTGRIEADPTTYPITESELRSHLRISGEEAVADFISAASYAVENYINQYASVREVTLKFVGSGMDIVIPARPVSSVKSLKIDNVTMASGYTLKTGLVNQIVFDSYQSGEIELVLNVAMSPVPASVKMAVKMLAADLYEHRESQAESTLTENKSFKFALDPHRHLEVY